MFLAFRYKTNRYKTKDCAHQDDRIINFSGHAARLYIYETALTRCFGRKPLPTGDPWLTCNPPGFKSEIIMKRIVAMSLFLVLAPNLKLAGGPAGPALQKFSRAGLADGRLSELRGSITARTAHPHKTIRAIF